MSPLLQCIDVAYKIGNRRLFKDLSLSIHSGDRVGLVGNNGSGKSTLLSILAGGASQDHGSVIKSRQTVVGFVEQFLPEHLNRKTVFEVVDEKNAVQNDSSQDYLVERLLFDLNFAEEELSKTAAELSGGQMNLLMFARAMINEPNLVLFDEPTNHLDLDSLLTIESFLKRHRDFAFIIVSHDRSFLDVVTDHTFFLRDQTIYSFPMPYSRAISKFRDQDAAALARRKTEDKKIGDLQKAADRYAQWGRVYDNEDLARRAKSMEKRISRLEDQRTFVTDEKPMTLSLNLNRTRSKRMLLLQDFDINMVNDPNRLLFHIETLSIQPGDRVALLGENGVGKTTLIRHIFNKWQDGSEGENIVFNPQCKLGYYDQELENLPLGLDLAKALFKMTDAGKEEVRQALIKAGFPYDDHSKSTDVLSGGEKARLLFLVLSITAPNFLILDEPTNHIDISGREELEEQLLASRATILVTSHDRSFIQRIANRFLLIEGQRLQEIIHPEKYYQNLLNEKSGSGSQVKSRGRTNAETGTDQPLDGLLTEEQIIEKIALLEEKLTNDQKQKPKFQKPDLQAELKDEIKKLYELI